MNEMHSILLLKSKIQSEIGNHVIGNGKSQKFTNSISKISTEFGGILPMPVGP